MKNGSMKKYIFSFILIIALSLSALYLFESKEVKAVENSNYNRIYDVRFELLNQQTSRGVTWSDNFTSVKSAFFNSNFGFYTEVNDVITYSVLIPNMFDDYTLRDFDTWQAFNIIAYVEIVYNGQPCLFRLSRLEDTSWYNSLDTTKIDISVPFVVRYQFIGDYLFSCEFNYRIGATQNANGSFTYQTTTSILPISNIFSLGSISTIDNNVKDVLNPVSYGDELFIGWNINNQLYTYYDLFDLTLSSSFSALATYSNQSSYVVNFYDGFNLLGSYTFGGGYGTITVPEFTFSVGQVLQGWSLKLGGFVVSLDNFYLVEDTDFYAIKIFNSNSTINSGDFEIPYQDCGNFDIPCHLGNAVVYFLNEFPLVSDIASFIYPIGDFLIEFPQYFQVFESLGFIFVFSMGILLMTFIFRLLR